MWPTKVPFNTRIQVSHGDCGIQCNAYDRIELSGLPWLSTRVGGLVA